MTERAPAVSVILPVHNGMPYLPLAVESVLAQSLRDFELLVIDDGSDDDTTAFLGQLDDPRVEVIRSGRRGLADALNAGLARARGLFVARCDADDWNSPERLERQIEWLTRNRDVDVLATSVEFADEHGAPVDSEWTRTVHAQWDAALEPAAIGRLMPLTCCIFHATVMARTKVLRDAGGYDSAMVPAEDYDLWLRLLPHHRFARLPERLYTVRVHAQSSSTLARAEQTSRVIAAKLRFLRRQVPGLPRPATLALPFNDRGAAVFRAVGPSEGYEVVHGANDEDAARTADVIAVTNLAAVENVAQRLDPDVYLQFGNLFVRRRPAGRDVRSENRSAGRQSDPPATCR